MSFIEDLENRVGYHINVVSHMLRNKYNEELAKYDVTMAQAKVLYVLRSNGEQTQNELQEKLYVKASSVNGIVETMLKKGLIEKRTSDIDRRTKIITLSQKGTQLETKLRHVIYDLETELGEGFSEEELKVMISWLKRMQGNIYVKN
ncbi:MarR family transcripitonal regulator [Pontibacillus halophilus JSM 076056 = DSM 19796]|uniref:MarR family transcripitonal regulator n=1 Tax=Pontibacillus halophilus JSM 076056 = DSM 19796 TaxID=1385510 RepID=A0A0A5GR96_9BACI|nr:MarR family transcriptional regulator [Pontibacillus halophilus]KGX93778.1 MarR family transcripitonal regulator [Pontibacillus halophilus JSM 076056 = DSM 19796]